MLKKTKKLITLIIAIVIVTIGGIGLTFASIRSFKYGNEDYSHNLKIKEVKTDNKIDNDVVYHQVTIEGKLTNNTNINYSQVSVEIVFDGVNNSTGIPAEYTSSFNIDELGANSKSDLTDKQFKIGNRSGYIPQTIKEVRLILDGKIVVVEYEQIDELNLIVFAVSLALILISVLVFVKWHKINVNKVESPKDNGCKTNENLD